MSGGGYAEQGRETCQPAQRIKMQIVADQTYKIKEVAEFFRVRMRTISSLYKKGEIISSNGGTTFKGSAILKFMDEHQV